MYRHIHICIDIYRHAPPGINYCEKPRSVYEEILPTYIYTFVWMCAFTAPQCWRRVYVAISVRRRKRKMFSVALVLQMCWLAAIAIAYSSYGGR